MDPSKYLVDQENAHFPMVKPELHDELVVKLRLLGARKFAPPSNPLDPIYHCDLDYELDYDDYDPPDQVFWIMWTEGESNITRFDRFAFKTLLDNNE